MDIKAFKMDGLGNDFVIIDQRSQDFNLDKDQIIKICDRSFIGCDQLILIKKNKEIDANVEFFNSDGSISGACGNGTRCVADLLSKESGKKEITLLTTSFDRRSATHLVPFPQAPDMLPSELKNSTFASISLFFLIRMS